MSRRTTCRAVTLIELVLVMGLLVAITAMVLPNFIREIRQDPLSRSGRQMRSLISLARAHAAYDGLRYRIRFLNKDEEDVLSDDLQPRVEREGDPIKEPEVFSLVLEPWAREPVFLRDTWCIEVRLGRPTVQDMIDRRERAGERIEDTLKGLEDRFENLDPQRPPLVIETDGTTEWATFVLTTAPPETQPDELEGFAQVELILDGLTGLAWLQRPFYDEELDLFEEKRWPVVLRQDFLDKRVLTENDVLELREAQVRGREVELSGQEIKTKEETVPTGP